MIFIPGGLGELYVTKELANMVDLGLNIDAVELSYRTLKTANYRAKKHIIKMREQGKKIILNLTTADDIVYENILHYVDDYVDYYIVPEPTADISDDRQIVPYNVEHPTHYAGVYIYDEDKKKYFTITDNIKKEHPVKVYWLGYSSFNKIINFNGDYIISSAWAYPTRNGQTYMLSKGRLVLRHFDDIEYDDWEAFVDGYVNKINEFGLDIDKIKDISRIRREHNLFNLIVILTYIDDNFVDAIDGDIIGEFGCFNCPMKNRCPYYKPGYTGCKVIERKLNNVDETDMFSIMESIIREKYMRYLRGRVFEDIGGGTLDRHVSLLEDSISKLIETYLKLKYPGKYTSGGKSEDSVEDKLEEELKRVLAGVKR